MLIVNEVFCVFCKKSSKDDYFLRKTGEIHGPVKCLDKNKVVEYFFHFYCAFWAPMVTYTFDEEKNTDDFTKIKETIALAKKLPCHVCKQRGAALGCWYKKCKKSFHYLCAKQAKCFFDHPNVFCEAHLDLSENKKNYKRKNSVDSFSTVEN